MNAMTAMRPLVPAKTVMGGRALRRSVSNGAVTVAKQLWCPGGQGKLNPTYLDGTLRACPLVVEPGLCWLCHRFHGPSTGARVVYTLREAGYRASA
jgi:hypothetical protein